MRATRRRLLLSLGAGALACPHLALGQQSGRTDRIGWGATANAFNEPYSLAFVERLRDLGFIEGRNLVIERLHADNRLEKLPALSAQFAKLKCDVFFGGGGDANLAMLSQANATTPIVFIAVDFDPAATADVASLARPGGRLTGVTALQSTLPAKRLELLKEALPELRKLAVFTNERTAAQLALVQGIARRLGIAVHVIDLKRSRRLIPQLALKARLPTCFTRRSGPRSAG
ncbi:MAG: ABC transporter substrate binding protein [Betaproteobacteria bacterium]